MVIAYEEEYLRAHVAEAVVVSPDHPVLLDRFLEGAIEVDVDAVCDGREVYIGGIMEHIEEAGIHSGDSACCIPHFSLPDATIATIREHTRRIALAISTHGLINIQFAVKDGYVYVLEVNPRASRTVPFVSKATGVPLAKVAARVMAGEMLADLGLPEEDRELDRFCVKEAVMPWGRFPGADPVLGPEMKSTGEAMGCGGSFGVAFAKAQAAVGQTLPDGGTAFISVNDHDKPTVLPVAKDLVALGFTVAATRGTAAFLAAHGIPAEVVYKVNEGRPNIADEVVNGRVSLVINTPLGRASFFDDRSLRRAAMMQGVPCITTLTGAAAAVSAIRAMRTDVSEVRSLQDYHAGSAT